jgi:hypothetical protein
MPRALNFAIDPHAGHGSSAPSVSGKPHVAQKSALTEECEGGGGALGRDRVVRVFTSRSCRLQSTHVS